MSSYSTVVCDMCGSKDELLGDKGFMSIKIENRMKLSGGSSIDLCASCFKIIKQSIASVKKDEDG